MREGERERATIVLYFDSPYVFVSNSALYFVHNHPMTARDFRSVA